MRPQIVIICENTLSSMALRSLLSDMVPAIDVVSYNNVAEYNIEDMCRDSYNWQSKNPDGYGD